MGTEFQILVVRMENLGSFAHVFKSPGIGVLCNLHSNQSYKNTLIFADTMMISIKHLVPVLTEFYLKLFCMFLLSKTSYKVLKIINNNSNK